MLTLRPLAPADDAALARVIRDTLTEFGAAKPGTVYFDPTTDHLSAVFAAPRSAYFVAELNGKVVGGGGIYPTAGLPADTVELVKLYLRPVARRRGVGRQLIEQCLGAARGFSYGQVYLETMAELTSAVPLYERLGFVYLPAPLGQSGHFGCPIWMRRAL